MPLLCFVYPDDFAALLGAVTVAKKAQMRILVKCSNCVYFEKDLLGSGQGAGHCSISGEGIKFTQRSLYPNGERVCQQFLAKPRALRAATHA